MVNSIAEPLAEKVFRVGKNILIMLLHNLELQPVDVDALKAELISDLAAADSGDVPNESEIEEELASLYVQADKVMAAKMYEQTTLLVADDGTLVLAARRNVWQEIRKFLCRVLKADSIASDIIDALLEALASIIPGGIIIKSIVKKVVKYLLNLGYERFCPVVNPAIV